MSPNSVEQPKNKKKFTKIGRYIKSSLTVRDSSQLEAVFDFTLRPKKAPPGAENRTHSYTVEAFFFFPKQMQVSPRTFPKQEFLNDIRPFIRLQEPRLSFREMMGDAADQGVVSPLKNMRKIVEDFRNGNKLNVEALALDQARLFACSYKRYFQKKISRSCRYLSNPGKSAKKAAKNGADDKTVSPLVAEEILGKAWTLLGELRKLGATIDALATGSLADLRQEIRYVDEYCTYQFRHFLAQISSEVSGGPVTISLQDAIHIKKRISAWSRLERYYSLKSGYLWADRVTSELESEAFFERHGMLKYRMWSVLLLDARVEALFAFRLQIGKMVAAGLAAIWALIANIYILRLFQLGGMNQFNFSNVMGATGFLVIMASVFAYILKDRIKEISREHWSGGFLKKLPATQDKIRYTDARGQQVAIGSIKEFGDYLGDKVDDQEIAKLRISRFRHLPNGRNHVIFRYKKNIRISGRALSGDRNAIFGLQDVLRLNVNRFTDRLENPSEPYLSIDKLGETRLLTLPTNYSIDLILRYSRRNRRGVDVPIAAECHRLVINKAGIVRIDQPGWVSKVSYRRHPADLELLAEPGVLVDQTGTLEGIS